KHYAAAIAQLIYEKEVSPKDKINYMEGQVLEELLQVVNQRKRDEGEEITHRDIEGDLEKLNADFLDIARQNRTLARKKYHDEPEEDVIFAIDVGDLVYDGEKEKYRFFINQIKKLNKPLLTVIGNHELKREGRANYYELFGKFYYSFVVGDSYFIILDDANTRNLDPWQMDWLKDELQKS
ncbi:unnamed protein product, partial [marine sediment metagenome]